MNYFFFTKADGLNCSIQIPRFKNNGKYGLEYKLYCADVKHKQWIISEFNCESDSNFFYVKCKNEIKMG